MSKTLDITGIDTTLKSEIARFASRIVDEGGNMLYEALVYYSNDEGEIWNGIADASSSVQSVFADVLDSVTVTNTSTAKKVTFVFNLPDHPTSYSSEESDLRKVIADDVVVKWFRRRGRTDIADIISAERDAGIERLQHNIYHRKPVSRT